MPSSAARRLALRRMLVSLGGVAVVAMTSCDPCSTTLDCSSSPVVAVVGQIVDGSRGMPVANVRIDITRQSGVGLAAATASTTTRPDGTFSLSLGAVDTGEVVVTIGVATPNQLPYRVPDVHLRTVTTTGSATVLPPWVNANPSIPYVVVVRPDVDKDVGLADATVIFRRTAGPQLLLNGAPVSSVSGTTNSDGWVFLFRDVRTDTCCVITGDVIVHSPTSSDSLVIPQVVLNISPRFEAAFGFAAFSVGAL